MRKKRIMAGLLAFAMLLTLGPTLTRAKADGATGGTLTDPLSYTLDASFSGTGLLVAQSGEKYYALGALATNTKSAEAKEIALNNAKDQVVNSNSAMEWTLTNTSGSVTLNNGSGYLTAVTTGGGKFALAQDSDNWTAAASGTGYTLTNSVRTIAFSSGSFVPAISGGAVFSFYKKVGSDISLTVSNNQADYTGSVILPTVVTNKAVAGYTVKYSMNGTDWYAEADATKDNGFPVNYQATAYTVSVALFEGTRKCSSVDAAVTIAKAEVALPTANESLYAYTGSKQTLVEKEANAKYQLVTYTGCNYTIDESGNAVATNAGTYSVKAELLDSANTAWSSPYANIAATIAKASVTPPSAKSASYTYDGSAQTLVEADTNNPKRYVIQSGTGYTVDDGGNAVATNAGTYTVNVALVSTTNYAWSTTFEGTISATIDKKTVQIPEPKAFQHDGTEKTGITATSDFTISGTAAATEKGSYEVTLTLVDANRQWSDGTTTAKTYRWSIADTMDVTVESVADTYITLQKGDSRMVLAKNGGSSAKTFAVTSTTANVVTISEENLDNIAPGSKGSFIMTASAAGTTTVSVHWSHNTGKYAKINVAVYEIPSNLTATYGDTLAKVALPEHWSWKDATTTSVGAVGSNSFTAIYDADGTATTNYAPVEVTLTVTVGKIPVAVPTAEIVTAYTGSAQTLVKANEKYTLSVNGTAVASGDAKATNAGAYVVRATLADTTNTAWADGTAAAYKEVTVTIDKASVELPTAEEVEAYTGTEQTLVAADVNSLYTLETYDGCGYTINAGAAVATNAGTYNVKATLDNNHKWSETYADITVTIEKAGVDEPQGATGLVYDGTPKTLVEADDLYTLYIDGVKVESGDAKATDAGTYIVEARLDSNHKWNTTFSGNLQVTIAKKPIDFPETAYMAYTGSTVVGVSATADYTVGTDASAAVIGQHQTTLTLTDAENTRWSDIAEGETGCSAPRTYTWYINNQIDGTVTDGGVTYYVALRRDETCKVKLQNVSGDSRTYSVVVASGSSYITVSNATTAAVADDGYMYFDIKGTAVGTAAVSLTASGHATEAVTVNVTVYDLPSETLTAVYGDTLSDVTLPQHWSWVNPNASVGNKGTNRFAAIYDADDAGTNYKPIQNQLEVVVSALDLTGAALVLNIPADGFYMDGYEKKPTVLSVTLPGASEPLNLTTADYDLTYENNIEAKNADEEDAPKVTLTGKGNYTGSISATFTIQPPKKADIAENAIVLSYKEECGLVIASSKTGSVGDLITIYVTPADGYKVTGVYVGDAQNNSIRVKTVVTDKVYTFIMPVNAVKVTVLLNKDVSKQFADVESNAYYYDAVVWAVENGITQGLDDTHFGPNAVTTRAQMVTFMWRAAGCPEPQSTTRPFTDVPAGCYYEKAVMWAVEEGITKGATATTFAPDAPVTRAQTVTFLWRFSGAEDFAAKKVGFTDVPVSEYYFNAVYWAKNNGITSGVDATTFAPDNDCIRAQIVTFLYRYFNK